MSHEYSERDLNIMQAEYDHASRQARARVVEYLLELAEGIDPPAEIRRHFLLDVEFVRDELMAWALADYPGPGLQKGATQ
jgi:hypothetical protein